MEHGSLSTLSVAEFSSEDEEEVRDEVLALRFDDLLDVFVRDPRDDLGVQEGVEVGRVFSDLIVPPKVEAAGPAGIVAVEDGIAAPRLADLDGLAHRRRRK